MDTGRIHLVSWIGSTIILFDGFGIWITGREMLLMLRNGDEENVFVNTLGDDTKEFCWIG